MTNSKDNKTKAPNVPPLRFPEFTDEWVEITIQNLATVLGGGTPDTTNKSYWDGNIQWFTPSEIGKNKYVNTSLRTITEDGLNNSSAKLLPPHTILLSSRATVGECSLTLQECATNQGFQSLIAKNCDTDFLYYLIQTKKKELIKKSCGSTFLEISANEVRKIKVAIPTKEEQLKISLLLSLLDERIATQNKIIDNLQSLIKGLAKTHYDSCDVLQQVKIIELGEPYSVMNLSKEQLSDNGQPCILYGELFTQYGPVIESIYSKTNVESNLSLSNGRDLLFPSSTTVDALSLIAPSALTKPNIILGGDMFGIKVANEFSPEYLSYYFNYIGNHELAKYAIGSTIIHLHYKDIAEHTIAVPTLRNQLSFVKLASTMKSKIENEKYVLHNLKTLKAYLLQAMFI